jgi:hypothetical protein
VPCTQVVSNNVIHDSISGHCAVPQNLHQNEQVQNAWHDSIVKQRAVPQNLLQDEQGKIVCVVAAQLHVDGTEHSTTYVCLQQTQKSGRYPLLHKTVLLINVCCSNCHNAYVSRHVDAKSF